MDQVQLFVTDHGDDTLGYPELTFIVDVPIIVNDVKNLSDDESERLEIFRRAIKKVFTPYCEGHISADYDFETIIDD